MKIHTVQREYNILATGNEGTTRLSSHTCLSSCLWVGGVVGFLVFVQARGSQCGNGLCVPSGFLQAFSLQGLSVRCTAPYLKHLGTGMLQQYIIIPQIPRSTWEVHGPKI